MRLKHFALSRQRAVDERAILQQRVEHADQRALVVVPAQTELLIVVHDYRLRFCCFDATQLNVYSRMGDGEVVHTSGCDVLLLINLWVGENENKANNKLVNA